MRYMGFTAIFLICSWAHLLALDWTVRGQAATWVTSQFTDVENTQMGLQYIPFVSASQNVNASLIDAEFAVNSLSSYDFQTQSGTRDLDTYRAWLRYSSAQFEARLGIQQIKFGPAMMLRPLMWFDQLDPRDPLQFTQGVTGGLVRYYFLNNANIWLWGLLSNGEPKGLEIVPSENHSLEYGGRVQYPIGTGELAFTFFRRRADAAPLLENLPGGSLDPFYENRYALDGKWDIGIGLWFESVLVHKDIDLLPITYQKYLTIGADYTLGLGNGLHILGEHLLLDVSEELARSGERTEFSAVLADYHLSLWDMLMGIVYYNWKTDEWYNFFTWRRTYDNWSLNASVWLNPERTTPAMTQRQDSLYGAGKGFQIMLIFNH